MNEIKNIFKHNPKYQRLSKPLTAARVCDAARSVANGRFIVLSFCDGLLTIGTKNSGEAANVQLESRKIIQKINRELGEDMVKKMRFKMS